MSSPSSQPRPPLAQVPAPVPSHDGPPGALTAADFDFELPDALIAQTPAPARDQSRLLRVTASGVSHHRFTELPALLRAELATPPLLVLNDTKVLPARLCARKILADDAPRRSGPVREGGGRVELLLCDPLPAPAPRVQRWRAMSRASKPVRPGQRLELLDPERGEPAGAPPLTVAAVEGEGRVLVDFADTDLDGFYGLLDRVGAVPLPPYIRRARGAGEDAEADPEAAGPKADRERYQTVFARAPGSVAAPTAGLHFTPALLAELAAGGCERAHVTLHVGPGTFLPLRSDDLDAHVMHAERYHVPDATAAAIAAARAAGRPVLAVGTTVVRTLESATPPGARVPQAGWGQTRLFIRPPYRFRAVDALLTNFHLPKSTLLMLVASLAGRRRVLSAYAEAIAAGYRFYSYGDAMLIPRALPDLPDLSDSPDSPDSPDLRAPNEP